MDTFSEKSLLSLGEFYVYGLIDPRTNKIFYIGKGKGNRVFEHEKENLNNPNSDKLKLVTIGEIKAAGLQVKKIIISSNLTEAEAFAAEAALINAFNYVDDSKLTNIVAGHHSTEALTVENFEKIYGAEELREEDIRHKILVIKINKLYRRDMPADVLYDSVRGTWRASLKNVQNVEYVFGVFNSLIVAVYKPSKWYICKDEQDKLPRQDVTLTSRIENRVFFVDQNFENGLPHDENEEFYYGKSIAALKVNQSAQNPITYLYPRAMKYESLTKYIPLIAEDTWGEWHVDIEHRGTLENPIQMPYVEYSPIVRRFINEVYDFVDSHRDMKLANYVEILGDNGLNWDSKLIEKADVSKLNDHCIMALIVGALRAEHFCEGALLKFFKNGCILSWLERLKEIDN